MRQAEQKGLQGKQALAYGTIMGALESGTEQIGKGLTEGVATAGKELLKATGKKEIKSKAIKVLASYGLDIGENFFEEAIMEPLEEVVTQATGGQADYSNIKARMIQSGIDGALTSIIMGGASAGIGSAVGIVQKAENGQAVTQEDIKKALIEINKSEELDIEKMLVDNFNFNPQDFVDVTEVNQARDNKMEKIAGELTPNERLKLINNSDLDDRQKESLSEIAEKYQLTADEIQNAINKTLNGEYAQNQETTIQNNEVLNGEQQITQAEGQTAQNETSNDIGLNLRKSIDAYNNSRQEGQKIFDINDENTRKEIDAIQKIAEKRGINVTFDESRFNNNNINAFYEYDDNGNVANIVLNPNTSTKKYVQNLVVHEMTHSFEGSKEYEKLSKAVLDYAKSKGEYNKAFQDLKNTYAGVYSGEKLNQVVEKEAVANILGEKLGSKEFIDDLVNGTYSQENRNFVQKIYDFVKEQINRFKGYKDQEAYWNNVKKLFDEAYNKSEVSQEGIKNSVDRNNQLSEIETFSTDSYEGQTNHVKQITDKDGNVVAKLEYAYYEGRNHVQMIEVDPKYRRQGLAKKLLQSLQEETPDKQIFFGMTTPDGTKLIENVTEKVKNPLYNERKAKKINKLESQARELRKQIEDYNDKLRPFAEKNRNGTLTEQEHQEWRRLGKEQMDLMEQERVVNEEWYKLDQKVKSDELREFNTFVKLDDNKQYSIETPVETTKQKLNERISGDRLLNTQDLIDEIKQVGANVDEYGYVTLYHQTTPENAQKIKESRKMSAKEDGIFFSTSKNAQQSEGRGTEKLEFKIPAEMLQLDDIFDDNADLKIPLKNKNQELDVSDYLVNDNIQKQKQFEIIQESNPRDTSLGNHTWIDSVDDIKTFQEALDYDEYDGQNLTPDFTADDVNKALDSGTITVYSSYPIEDGIFVTPSKMEAQNYAGNGQVYSKEVNLNDVAWIDSLQGQYAKVEQTQTSTTDSQGRTLSKQQQEYFKDSKARDDKGNLLTLYHGTPNGDFTVFRDGTYLTSNKEYADRYQSTSASSLGNGGKEATNPKTFEVYANIKTPFTLTDSKARDIYINEYIKGGNALGINPYENDSFYNGIETIDWTEGEDLREWLQENYPEYDSIILDEGGDIGYDGENYTGKVEDRGESILVFNPNQIKNIDNTNPTTNPDIRFSQDVTGAWNNFMDKYFKTEGTGTAIKDMKKLPVKTYSMQDIDNVLNETTLSDELKQEFRNDLKGKTITKEIFNEYKDAIKQVEKDYESYNAERPPSWDNLGEVFEQPSEEVESPLQDRDIETIGKDTKKNAYQYENPEVKPYFQEMAQMIGEDLAYASDSMNRRTKKGGGTVLQANTKAINDLHNKYGYSYEQIGTGLNNIIEDNGAENNAVSKKIEFYIDDALRNGYRNIQGTYIQPNQDYINTIQYSMETENQAEKIEEEKPKPKVLNPTQISNLTLEDVSTTPKLPNKKYKEGSKVSSFVSNIENDVGFLNEEEKQELLKDDNVKFYAGITNADTLAQAYDNLKENGKDATLKWYAKPTANATAEDVATGWILLKQYSDNGDTEGMVNVAKKLRDMGTKAGQTVQAFNILSRLTPEGMVAYTQGELQDAYSEMIKGKSKKWIDQHKSDFDLSQDEIAFIMDTMQNLPAEDPTNNNYDRKVALGQIQKLFTDKIPSENNRIKAWMRISMLFNPKTQVRNVSGNAGVIPVNMTSDFLGSKVDKVLSKYTGVRTLGNPNAKAYLKGMKEGFYQSYNDFKLGINTRDIEQNKFEFGQGKAFKDKGIGKALNRVDNMLNFIMDFGDRGFSQASFVNSLNNQMVLNGVTTPTQDMIDIATQEALSRTWNDNNEYTKFVLGVRRALNKVGTKNYGLGDVLIPFAKTPANLTKAIVEYSPVGLTKQILNIKDIKNAIETGQFTSQQQHEFADKMGKGLAGTLLYIAGYALAQAGIATGEPDEDKDVKNFMKNSLGIAPYSIKIGDKSFTYDWSQPVATPLAIMTNLYQTNKNNPDATMLDKIMSATNIGTNQLMEQSFMESLNEVLNGNGEITDRIQKAILDLPARAIPTFSKQIADMVDGTQRTSFEYGQPVKSAINSAKAKLPFVSKELTPVVDTLGNEVEKYGGENNWFNVFFNPANMNKGKKTKAGEEIYNVYQETGDTTIFPVTAPYYVNQDGAKITMDSKQRAEYQKTAGDYTEETVNKLINDSDYQKLDDFEKAEILSQVVKDSNEKAKRDVLNINNKSSDLELIDKVGADYYTYKIATKGMKTDAEQCEALERKNYSNQNKQLIYESEINKDDKTFEGLKKINKNFNMDEYLKYKTQKFSGDTKKEDTINYVNGLNLNGIERLYIIGRTYKLKEDRELFESLLKNKMPLQDVDSILQTLK